MSLAKQVSHKITEDEYLAGEQKSDVRHELIDGIAYAMAGGSENHNLISLNLAAEFRSQLKGNGSDCKTFMSDMKVKTKLSRGKNFYYPDVMVVVCDTQDKENQYYQTTPALIIEVLSKSTEKFDKSEKRQAYLSLDSLEEYVLIEQDKCEIIVFEKSKGWQPSYYFLEDTITFNSIGVTISVEDLYYQVDNQDILDYLSAREE